MYTHQHQESLIVIISSYIWSTVRLCLLCGSVLKIKIVQNGGEVSKRSILLKLCHTPCVVSHNLFSLSTPIRCFIVSHVKWVLSLYCDLGLIQFLDCLGRGRNSIFMLTTTMVEACVDVLARVTSSSCHLRQSLKKPYQTILVLRSLFDTKETRLPVSRVTEESLVPKRRWKGKQE